MVIATVRKNFGVTCIEAKNFFSGTFFIVNSSVMQELTNFAKIMQEFAYFSCENPTREFHLFRW